MPSDALSDRLHRNGLGSWAQGPLLTLGIAAVAGAVIRPPLPYSDVGALLIVSAIVAALRGGATSGLASTLIVLAYRLYSSVPIGLPLVLDAATLRGLIADGAPLLAAVWLVGAHGKRLGLQRERERKVLCDDGSDRPGGGEVLHSGEDRDRLLYQDATDVVAIVDLDWTVRFVGPSVERHLGYTPAEIVGRRGSDFVHPEDRLAAAAAFQRAVLDRETAVSGTARMRRKDGEWRPYEYTLRNLAHHPSLRGIVATARDVTEREAAKRWARAVEDRFRGHFDSIPVGLYRSLADGTILEANRAMVEILRYPDLQTLLDTNARDLYVDPEDRGRFQALVESDGVVRDFETMLRRYDGSVFPARLSTRAITDASGRLHYEGALEDSTERHETEHSARKTLELFRLLQRAANDPIYDWDIVGAEVHWNEATHLAFDYSPEDIGRDLTWWSDRLHPEDRARVLAALQDALEGNASVRHDEYRFRRGDGTYASVYDRGHIVRDERGMPVRLIGSMIDVTASKQAEEERRQLEEQLRQAQKMEAVGRLAGGIAHDFNNLLTAIQGHAEVLLEGIDPSSPNHTDVEQIRRAAERAAVLTQQLLAFSRRQVLQPRTIDLNHVVREIESMLVRLIGEHIELATVLDDQLGTVRADPGQIEQVIVNLVVNARDAMPGGGKITILTRNVTLSETDAKHRGLDLAAGDYVVLSVSDTGEGMSDQVRTRIFEPFFTTKEMGKGTGLGLSTVYGIVTQSGGGIEVESQVGAGTTFHVYLPLEMTPADEENDADSARAPEMALPHGSEVVLLVEDEQAVRALLSRILRQRGYTVLEARSGTEALEIGRSYEGDIDLLLTDVVMPEMGGRELAEQLLLDRPNTRVLFISGYTEDEMVHAGVLATRINFLEKPFAPRDLVRKVREVLDMELFSA